MAKDTTESEGFIALIDAKIAALQALKDSYVAAVSIGALGPGLSAEGLAGSFSSVTSIRPSAAVDLPIGAFRSLSIPEGIRLYLESSRQKRTAKEIADALRDGGLVSTAKNFDTTVTSALHRMKEQGAVLKFKEGWDLSASYPEHLRAKLGGKEARPSKPSRKKRRTAKPAKSPAETLDSRILALLAREKTLIPRQIAEALRAEPKAIVLPLARLARYAKVEKHSDGSYSPKAS